MPTDLCRARDADDRGRARVSQERHRIGGGGAADAPARKSSTASALHATGPAPRRAEDRRPKGLGEARVAGSDEPPRKRALEGIRQMPSHGGNQNLTDIEIERAITYMVNQSGGHWTEPTSRDEPTGRPQRRADRSERCATCHQTGEGGAPRIGDRSAWIPRIKQGLDSVVRSAINGHGGMPARGGQADLTDAELRSAIVYMMNPAPVAAAVIAPPRSDGRGLPRGRRHRRVLRCDRDRRSIRHSPTDYPAKTYGTPPIGPGQYYVTIALFDANTGRRITDASVRARVSTATDAGPGKGARARHDQGRADVRRLFRDGGQRSVRDRGTDHATRVPDTIRTRFEYGPR